MQSYGRRRWLSGGVRNQDLPTSEDAPSSSAVSKRTRQHVAPWSPWSSNERIWVLCSASIAINRLSSGLHL